MKEAIIKMKARHIQKQRSLITYEYCELKGPEVT
jgi:hypothetical protein